MTDPPLQPWQRMGLHTHVMLKIHPRLQPVLSSGASVWVDADEDGCSALLVHAGRIREARLTHAAWYEPNLPETGAELAERLAAALVDTP